jgi:hypothetical protein
MLGHSYSARMLRERNILECLSLLENLHIGATLIILLHIDLCNALVFIFCIRGSVRIFSSHFIFCQCFIHDYYEMLLNCIFISEAVKQGVLNDI